MWLEDTNIRRSQDRSSYPLSRASTLRSCRGCQADEVRLGFCCVDDSRTLLPSSSSLGWSNATHSSLTHFRMSAHHSTRLGCNGYLAGEARHELTPLGRSVDTPSRSSKRSRHTTQVGLSGVRRTVIQAGHEAQQGSPASLQTRFHPPRHRSTTQLGCSGAQADEARHGRESQAGSPTSPPRRSRVSTRRRLSGSRRLVMQGAPSGIRVSPIRSRRLSQCLLPRHSTRLGSSGCQADEARRGDFKGLGSPLPLGTSFLALTRLYLPPSLARLHSAQYSGHCCGSVGQGQLSLGRSFGSRISFGSSYVRSSCSPSRRTGYELRSTSRLYRRSSRLEMRFRRRFQLTLSAIG